ncbi:kinase-like domain-containing protein [Tricladium varicosporioides]|nr:kinase-like domain-containing protein [Hymenoscyphus varicosporioides]
MAPTSTALESPSSTYSDTQLARLAYESPETVRKRGNTFRLRREVEAMNYVQSHTSIPIPPILDIHLKTDEDKEESWILMKQLPGCQLGKAWPTMSESAQAYTIRQLKSYFEELHRLHPSDPGWIGSCSKGPAYDHRLNNMFTVGPFASISEFHDFLVAPVRNCPRPEWVAKYRNLLPDSHNIIFAHADVSWENILVDPATGNVTGILDWEMAGFWPDWWEYRKALFGSRSQLWWINILKEIIQAYPSETEADMELEMF